MRMSSLWTPGGEHRVPDDDPSAPQPYAPGPPPAQADEGDEADERVQVSPEELEAIREVQAQIRATPAIDVIANHAVQLFELAVVYLGVASPPDAQGRVPAPDLAQAGVAIDAMTALVDGLGARFGVHEQTLRDALSQIQMLYVQIAEASPAS
jgi:hypothetical protein